MYFYFVLLSSGLIGEKNNLLTLLLRAVQIPKAFSSPQPNFSLKAENKV